MDEFAQSREDDDLFADEFEPVPEPTVTQPAQRSQRHGATASGGAGAIPPNNKPPSGPAGQRGGRGGGAGGGRTRASNGRGLASSRYAQQSAGDKVTELSETAKSELSTPISVPQELATTAQPSTDPPTATLPTTGKDVVDTTVDETIAVEQAPPPSEPTVPQPPTRPTAVRGDRHLTGGPAHKKLTEAELTEKMEKMKILNAQKAERFRLSEEDSAAYARKEKEMAKKRVEEQKNARAMDMERAKNRQRKLAAQGGREWDSEKQEGDIVDGKGRGRSSEYVRGGHGGVIRGGLAGSRYAQADGDDNVGGQSGRGRGGFEIRGRGNKGSRGGSRGGNSNSVLVPTREEFPDLPTVPKPSANEPKNGTQEAKLPIGKAAGDWAEEMATPVEDKKVDL